MLVYKKTKGKKERKKERKRLTYGPNDARLASFGLFELLVGGEVVRGTGDYLPLEDLRTEA